MIVLDTNVISELMKKIPDSNVIRWVDSYPQESFYITSITKAEIETGVVLMLDGKKKQSYFDAINDIFSLFQDRILPFENLDTSEFALVNLQRKISGRPISFADAQIAAITIRRGFKLATRNIRDFEKIDHLDLVNPWLA